MLGLSLGLNKSTGGLNRPLLQQIPDAVAGLGLNRLNSDVVDYSNLVTNGDFSSELNGWVLDIGIQATIDTVDFVYSNKSAKITMGNGQFNITRTPITLTAGVKYFFKNMNKNTNANMNSMGLRIYSNTTIKTNILSDLSITDTWKSNSGIYIADGTETHLAFICSMTSGFAGVVNFDGIQVIKMSNTRYEDYTAEEMASAFPFTPTTGKTVIPQKPIRVYRDSDMAETDIGLIGNKLDTVSLLAFAGAGSAYVVKVTDQTNNGNNAVQFVAANCPRIVNAGVLEVDSNGDASMYFDGGNDYLVNTTLGIISQPNSILCKSNVSIVSGTMSIIDGTNETNRQAFLITSLNDNFFAGTIYPFELTTLTSKIYATIFKGVDSEIYRNESDKTIANLGTNSLEGITIGARYNIANFYQGHISDIIVFNRALTQAEVTKLNKL